MWAFSSVAERFVHIEEAAGSNPAMPTGSIFDSYYKKINAIAKT